MPRVFVTQDTKHNLAHALPYGDIEILEGKDYPLFTDGSDVVKRLRAKLKEFNPAQDYLLLVGDPILMALCMAILTEPQDHITPAFVRVLKWDRQAAQYIPVNITF